MSHCVCLRKYLACPVNSRLISIAVELDVYSSPGEYGAVLYCMCQ